MRASLIIPDNTVSVDGEGAFVDLVELSLNTKYRAIQWYDDHGEQEHRGGGQPEAFTDFTPYQKYVDAAKAEIAKRKVKEEVIDRQYVEAEEKAKAANAEREIWDKIPRNIQQTILDRRAAEQERFKQEAWDKMTPKEQRAILDRFGY